MLRGRPIGSWDDNIKAKLKGINYEVRHWIYWSQKRDQCRAVLENIRLFFGNYNEPPFWKISWPWTSQTSMNLCHADTSVRLLLPVSSLLAQNQLIVTCINQQCIFNCLFLCLTKLCELLVLLSWQGNSGIIKEETFNWFSSTAKEYLVSGNLGYFVCRCADVYAETTERIRLDWPLCISLEHWHMLFQYREYQYWYTHDSCERQAVEKEQVTVGLMYWNFIWEVHVSNPGLDAGYPETFRVFPHFFQVTATIVSKICPKPLPFISLQLHYSLNHPVLWGYWHSNK